MLSTQGTITFGKSSTSANGTNPGTGSTIGNFYSNWSATSSSNPAIIYQKLGTDVYSDNSYTIQAWETAANSIRFNIVFQDGDLGTGTPGVRGDTPIDEYVEGETISTVSLKTATGALEIPVPAASTTSTLSGGVGGAVNISLSSNKTEINEGESVVFSLSTTNISAGTLIPYAITGVSTTDITGSLTGNFEVGTTDTITVTTTEDETTDGDKTMTLALPSNGNVSTACIVKDTSKGLNYSITGPAVINESSSIQYDFEASNLVYQETFFWDITAVNPSAFVQLAGSFLYDPADTGAQGPLIQTAANNILNDSSAATLTIYRYAPAGQSGSVGVVSKGLSVIDISEDLFTVEIDTTVVPLDPSNGFVEPSDLASADPNNIVIRLYDRTAAGTGDLSGDIQFRFRSITGTPNLNTNTWYQLSTTNTDVVALFTMATPGRIYMDFKGTGSIQFGARWAQDTPNDPNDAAIFGGDLFVAGGKVTNVLNWGTQFNPVTFERMFLNCTQLVNIGANGHPRLMGTPGSMDRMFENCINFEGTGLGSWNMSGAVSVKSMFKECHNFVGDIGNWNTSSMTQMNNMFEYCHRFNTDIGTWDTSSVTNMSRMFASYYQNLLVPPTNQGLFNQDISNWDVSNVDNMDGMFVNHSSFNQDLENWCVTNILGLPQSFNFGQSVFDVSNHPVWGTCGGPRDPANPPAPPTNYVPAPVFSNRLEGTGGSSTAIAAKADSNVQSDGRALALAVLELDLYIGTATVNTFSALRVRKISGDNATSKYYLVGTYPNGTNLTDTNWQAASILAPNSPLTPSEIKVNITTLGTFGFGVTDLSYPRLRHIARTSNESVSTSIPSTGVTEYDIGTWIPVNEFDNIRIPGPRARTDVGASATESAAISIQVDVYGRGPSLDGSVTYSETLIASHQLTASAFSDAYDYLAP